MMFLLGAATASHQVEGDNFNNDIHAQEEMKHSGYKYKSGKAANHYVTYHEDIRKMHEAGLNAYRFSLEWSRIEPQEGCYDDAAIEHYRDVVRTCRQYGIEPVVTLFHFSSPLWLIRKGGWTDPAVIECFERYVEKVCGSYAAEDLRYVCTINEANIGLLIEKYLAKARESDKRQGNLQIGMDIGTIKREAALAEEENLAVFGFRRPGYFTAPKNLEEIEIIKEAHRRAVKIIHEKLPRCKAGLSLSLNDLQAVPGGEQQAAVLWQTEFESFKDAIEEDDYIGVQNYTRALVGPEGELPVPEGSSVTQMGYENYPEGLKNVVKRVYHELHKEILVTENGIATADDKEREEFIRKVMDGVKECRQERVPLSGYLHWSLIDNFEWQSGYTMQFGLINNDEEHTVKPSLAVLGSYGNSFK